MNIKFTEEQIKSVDPRDVIKRYETAMDNGGVTREQYRKAVEAVHKDDHSDMFDEDDEILDQIMDSWDEDVTSIIQEIAVTEPQEE